MASLLAKLFNYQASIPVNTLDPLDNDQNQLVGANGVFNGGSTDKKLLTTASDAADPPYDIDQLGAGPLARWSQAGVVKATLGNSGLFTMVNTDVNPGLNADRVDSIEGANIAKLDTALIPWSATWFYSDPNAAAIAEDQPELFVPTTSTAFTVTAIRIEYRGGSHTPGGALSFTLRRRGAVSEDLGVITLDNANNLPFTVYTNDIADKLLTAGDRIFIFKSATVGTITELNVSIFAEGTRKLS